MTHHMLSCRCGNQLRVASTDSGLRLTCARCKAQLTVPEMSRLRELPVAPPEAPSAAKAKASGKIGIWLMVIGAAKICAAKVLLPWSYRINLNQDMPESYQRWFYLGVGMFLLGFVSTCWTYRCRKANGPSHPNELPNE